MIKKRISVNMIITVITMIMMMTNNIAEMVNFYPSNQVDENT